MTTIYRVDYAGIGKHIRSARKEKHLTQAELAEITGLSEKHISNIERAVKIPSVDALVAICIALHIQPNNLLSDSLPEDMLMLREIQSRMRSMLSEQFYPETAENGSDQPVDLAERPPIGFASLGEKIPDQMLDFSSLFRKNKKNEDE